MTGIKAGKHLSVVALLVTAMFAAACTPAPPVTSSWAVQAKTFINVDQNPDWEAPDYDRYDEPYIMQVAFRVTIGVENSAQTWLVHNYPQIICKSEDGTKPAGPNTVVGDRTCAIPEKMGTVTFPAVTQPDITDLNEGAPIEILGTLGIMYEKDAIFEGGPKELWQGVAGAMKPILNNLLGSGALPETPEDIAALLGDVLGDALGAVGGILLGTIAGLGNPDDLIGIAPSIFIASGGVLRDLLGGLLPPVIDLVNAALKADPDGAFPDGLPIHLGVTNNSGYTANYQDDYTHYRVNYRSFFPSA